MASEADGGTIDAREAAHFGALAADWWDPRGSSAPLHQLNPPRLGWLREQIDRHWGADPRDRRPLAGRRALDVGCGAGLVAEPLARLGAAVTGVDAAPENVAAARAHAGLSGLAIDYRATDVAALDGLFDLVTCLEVIEHVPDPRFFVRALAARLGEGGLLVLSTPNRTPRSRAFLIDLAEGLGRIPRGTHDYAKFITPDELGAMLAEAGLRVVDRTGIAWSVGRGFALSDDLSLNYLLCATQG